MRFLIYFKFISDELYEDDYVGHFELDIMFSNNDYNSNRIIENKNTTLLVVKHFIHRLKFNMSSLDGVDDGAKCKILNNRITEGLHSRFPDNLFDQIIVKFKHFDNILQVQSLINCVNSKSSNSNDRLLFNQILVMLRNSSIILDNNLTQPQYNPLYDHYIPYSFNTNNIIRKSEIGKVLIDLLNKEV